MNNIEKLTKKFVKETAPLEKKIKSLKNEMNKLDDKEVKYLEKYMKSLAKEMEKTFNLKCFDEDFAHGRIALMYDGVDNKLAQERRIFVEVLNNRRGQKSEIAISRYSIGYKTICLIGDGYYSNDWITLEQFCSSAIQKKLQKFIQDGREEILNNFDPERLKEKKRELSKQIKEINAQLKNLQYSF